MRRFILALRNEFPEISEGDAKSIAIAGVQDIAVTSYLYQRRVEVVERAVQAIQVLSKKRVRNATKRRLTASLTPACYAGILHTRRGEDPRNPDKGLNSGFARLFESPERFPGRMADAARYSDLRGITRPDSPWKDGLPRMIFVSDMGDALSREASFDYLYREIIEVVTSENGSRHIWQWLTKRPRRMAKFAKWLEKKGVPWPRNLVAMTSVTSSKRVGRIADLRDVPAAIRGLSVEPLEDPVKLDLKGIDWVICGGASGTGATAFDLAWARDLREQCRKAGVAFFMKQLGANPVENGRPLKLKDSHGGDWSEWPEDLNVREFPRAFHEWRSSLVG